MSSQQQTPSRYAPSTPHAIRALQERSSVQKRSVRRKRLSDFARPNSARAILRRFARITAANTRKSTRVSTIGLDKENQAPTDDGDDEIPLKRPRLTLDSIESNAESILEDEDEDDSELPTVPTPSILPDDGNNPTMTFKSIDFAQITEPQSEIIDRRRSQASFLGQEEPSSEEDEDEQTILTEIGRRALSEEPTGKFSRYSFGSIRMSDFGPDLEIRRDSNQTQKLKELEGQNDYIGFGDDDEDMFVVDGETEALKSLRRSPQDGRLDETTIHLPTMDEGFRLEVPDDVQEFAVSHQAQKNGQNPPPDLEQDDDFEDVEEVENEHQTEKHSPQITRQLTSMEMSAAGRTTRRKRLKMTRHGTMVPSLPSSLIKRIAIETQTRLGNRKPKLGRDHMKALEQATEWFFEQVGEDLEAFSSHARRKKRIDDSDVLMLMRRQRVVRGNGELEKLAQDWLPKDILSALDLPEEL